MKRYRREVYSYRGRANRRSWLYALCALLLTVVLAFTISLTMVLMGSRSDMEDDADTMIVLGCMVYEWGPSILLQDRLNTALDYWGDHPEITIIVTGGKGDDEHQSEAQAMYDYLTARGVPGEQILMEDRATNTYENMRFSAELMAEQGMDPEQEIVVVSNGFHLTRSRILFERAFGTSENLNTLAAPVSHLPSWFQMHLREPLALLKSLLFDR